MQSLDELLARKRTARNLPAPRVARLVREEAGLTQEELASVLGVSAPAISRWEAGTRHPRRAVAAAYAEALDRLRREAP